MEAQGAEGVVSYRAGPCKPLTTQQRRVADLVGLGIDAKYVALQLGISTRTVMCHIRAIAALIPNPDSLTASTLVMLWAAHERWLRDHRASQKAG